MRSSKYFSLKNKAEVYFMKRFMAMFLVLVMCIGCIPLSVSASHTRDVSKEQELAQQLKELGLFRGVSDSNFDLSREPTRVEALADFITEEAQDYSHSFGYEYTHTYQDTSFSLAYNPDEDFIYVYFEMDDAALAFGIMPDSETATSIFGRYNSNGIRVSNGSAMVDITEFSNDYEYSFYEYKGDDKTYDEMMAKILHAGARSLIDVIFSSIDGSSYSITDLGYISYDYEF